MESNNLHITFLGTGTSCGVPVIGCQCATCQSTHPKDHRLRCSILVETSQTRLLVDIGPDFRQQILPMPFRCLPSIQLLVRKPIVESEARARRFS
jgi:phosphoribosyl 1,2-cyclic phosphate phosphodiesterase